MHRHISNAFGLFFALVLIIVGIAGLFLPLIPGIIFLIAGLVVLNKAVDIPSLKRFESWLKEQAKKEMDRFRQYRIRKNKEKLKKVKSKIQKIEKKLKK
jgi:uncharacterized membrane protein YbaN (DUF454 family)